MSNKKTIILICFGILVLILAIVINPQEEKIEEKLLGINYNVDGNEATLSYDTSNPVVAIDIEKYGSVVIELYPDIAPNTVYSFISLVKKGFYDNNTFHRLMTGFVLQGGDPTGTGGGGPGYNIRGEFTSNGFENNLLHTKGVVSMARSDPYDSGGSQFFICLGEASWLDGNYAAFGKVIDGFEILEKIEEEETVVDKESGKLRNNLVMKKTLIDLKGNTYPEPETIK